MKYYYEERQCIIDEYYNGSKEKCKEFINIAFFNDTQKTVTHNEFEENLLKDIKIVNILFMVEKNGQLRKLTLSILN